MVYVEGSPGYYYLTSTEGADGLILTRSQTLEGLKTGESKVIWNDKTPSRSKAFWAPEFHQIDGTWYLYYSAQAESGQDQKHHLFVAKGGKSPWDDYTFLGQLSQGEDSEETDGTVINIPGRGRYFAFCCNERGKTQSVCIAPLLAPEKLGAWSTISSPEYDWEKNGGALNEAPHPLYHEDKVYMTFSASNCNNANYALGLLTWAGGDPLEKGSWKKSPEPVLRQANGNYATGHNSIFLSPDGTETWNVFHGNTAHPDGKLCDPSRYTMAERVYFNTTGEVPRFEQPQALSKVQTAPSGELEQRMRKPILEKIVLFAG
ncbi:MAG: hypothetical protein LQ342_003856 [Letrouitia transgressa]|nr:MAG: hypothetical protein LQ342_003856 [Letrouitia transgressa]